MNMQFVFGSLAVDQQFPFQKNHSAVTFYWMDKEKNGYIWYKNCMTDIQQLVILIADEASQQNELWSQYFIQK